MPKLDIPITIFSILGWVMTQKLDCYCRLHWGIDIKRHKMLKLVHTLPVKCLNIFSILNDKMWSLHFNKKDKSDTQLVEQYELTIYFFNEVMVLFAQYFILIVINCLQICVMLSVKYTNKNINYTK